MLRAYDRLLEVQQSLHREDVPVAERNLFQLRGNVKEVGYVRAYREDFLKTMDKDTNGSHPLRNMFKSLSFSPDGNLAVYENYDGNMKLIEKYIFASDGSDVLAEGERNGQPFRAAYTRKEGNFGITYRGSYEDGESGHGFIECDYALNMNGVPFNITHSRNAPPFVDFGDGERYDITYRYRQDGSLPSAMSFRFGYGGKSLGIQGRGNQGSENRQLRQLDGTRGVCQRCALFQRKANHYVLLTIRSVFSFFQKLNKV